MPICPKDRHLLGFTYDNLFYFDKCLPMGCRTSCAIFESFSKALHWIATHKLKIQGVTHILDDFIFVGPPQSPVTSNNLQSFLDLCFECNIPIKESKTVLPSTCIIAHGIEVDSVKMEARLPQDKLTKARDLLILYSTKRKITLKQLQSLIGLLNFACKAVAPGRAFLRRLVDLSCGVSKGHHHISLNIQARADIAAWLYFLQSFNGVSMFLHHKWSSSDAIKLFSDAAGNLGYAAVFGAKWLAGQWSEEWHSIHITAKELFPIVLAVEIWGPYLSNRKILFKTDNAAVAEIVNKQSCKDPTTMALVRCFVIASLRNNILFRATHISGSSNVVPDRLSRLQFQEARKLAPWLDPLPTQVPPHLMSVNLKPWQDNS